jgi:ribosome-associated translation inhibitor RaiA
MKDRPQVVFHERDVELDREVDASIRSAIDRRCEHLAEEFREVAKFELTLEAEGAGFRVHAHATGKHTDVATHADAAEPGPAVDKALEGLAKQLRKQHDKRIFAQRRDAQRDPPKRRSGE